MTSQKNNNTNRKIVDLDWLSLVAVLVPKDMAEYILTRRLSKKGEGGETPAQGLAAGTENNADSEPQRDDNFCEPRRDDTFTQGQISAAVAAAVEKIVPIILQEMRVKSEKNRDELEEEKTNERKSGRQKRRAESPTTATPIANDPKSDRGPSTVNTSPKKKSRASKKKQLQSVGNATRQTDPGGYTASMSNATVKPEPKERMSEKKIIQTAEDLDAMINAGGENRTARSGYKGNDLKPTDFRVVLPEEFSEQLIVKRSIKRAGEHGFKAKKFYPVFYREKMKKTAIYADWDSVEIIKYKHTGYFKFARANSFAEAYKKIVGWITRYNDELCQLCHMTSDSDDDE